MAQSFRNLDSTIAMPTQPSTSDKPIVAKAEGMGITRATLNSTRHFLSELRRYGRVFRYDDAIKLVLPANGEKLKRIYSKGLRRWISIRSNTTDLAVALKILENREYEIQMEWEPQLIIDAGANIGVSSLFFAKRFPSALIHAIEPEPQNFALLMSNCEGVINIVPHHAALWSHSARLSIKNENVEKWMFAVEEKPDSGDVPAITIPEILAMAGASVVDLLKLDVEGAEKAIFSNGAGEWLPSVRVILIELHDRYTPGCSNAFYSSICNRRFSQEVSGENLVVRFSPDT